MCSLSGRPYKGWLPSAFFFQCRSPAVSRQILFWVCFRKAKVCRVPECVLLTKHWISLVSALWSIFFFGLHIFLLCHASKNEQPKFQLARELYFIGMTTGKCWYDCFNPQCLCLLCMMKYVMLMKLDKVLTGFHMYSEYFIVKFCSTNHI